MLPSVLTSQLQTRVEDFLRTTLPTTSPHVHGMTAQFLDRNGGVFKGAYVNVGPTWGGRRPMGRDPEAKIQDGFLEHVS